MRPGIPAQAIEPTHAALAAALPLLSTDGGDWVRARIAGADVHQKPGQPRRSLKVIYTDERGEIFRDWLAFEHSPGARWHAVRKWQQLGGSMPAPNTASEALWRQHELARSVDILTSFDGKFWQVTQRRARPEQAA